MEIRQPYVETWFGDFGRLMLNIPSRSRSWWRFRLCLLVGIVMERGLIRYFYKRPHAEQILVTFGLAIVLQEIVKSIFGANPIPQPAPDDHAGMLDFGAVLGWMPATSSIRHGACSTLSFSLSVIGAVFAFLRFTTFGMVVRAGMADRETVGLLGIDIDKRFTIVFGIAAVVAGLAGVMYTPILSPDYHMGMDFLVLSFVVVVVGGMGSLGGRGRSRLPARHPAELRVYERSQEHPSRHRPDHHLPYCRRHSCLCAPAALWVAKA